MKRISLTFVAVLLAVIISACGHQNALDVSNPSGSTSNATVEATTGTTTPETTENNTTSATEEPTTQESSPKEHTEPTSTQETSEPTSAPIPETTETTPTATEPPTTSPKEESPTHKHTYTTTVVEATCTEGGYTLHKCECGSSYLSDETAATKHSYGKWKVTKKATAKKSGSKSRTCSVCGYVATKEIPKLESEDTTTATTEPPAITPNMNPPAHEHSYTTTVVEATCTEEGYTTYACLDCGDSYTGNKTKATGHNWGKWKVAKVPTTLTAGTEQRTCKNCGKTDSRSIAKLPEETKPAYETFTGEIGNYNAHNLAYTDWKGDTEQAAYIEIYTVEKNDGVLNALAAEFEKVYGFSPSLGDEYRCTSSCEKLGTYMVDGYTEPQTVYHYTITDKTYIYITNDMYKVYVQQCDDGSVWVGYCVYATMDTVDTERNKPEVRALEQEMISTFENLIGISWDEMNSYKDLLRCYISEAGTVRSVHSDKPVQVLYIYCRGFALEGDSEK